MLLTSLITGARLDNGACQVCVRDNGPGIPADKFQDIFRPFVSTKGSKGTGLGLPVSRKIVREHGGDIGADGRKLAVVGNSVGGNMAAVVSLMAKDQGQPKLRAQVLMWPVTDVLSGPPPTEVPEDRKSVV